MPDFGDGTPAGCKGKIDFLFVISRGQTMESRQAQLALAVPQFTELVALALFQGLEDNRGPRPRPVHPHEIRMEDHIGGGFVLLWLTADELARGPAGEGHQFVALRARFKDVNAGKPTNGRGYKEPTLALLAGFARNHFGGTTESFETKVQPRYLHVDEREVGGNFAGDDAHVDLQRGQIFRGED